MQIYWYLTELLIHVKLILLNAALVGVFAVAAAGDWPFAVGQPEL